MAIRDLIKSISGDKKMLTAVTIFGATGLCLIMLSSVMPKDSGNEKKSELSQTQASVSAEEYRIETEKRLTDFLENIEGVGEVKVYLTVGSEEEYVYATEGKTSKSDNKTEEELKYVMISESGSKSALIETVNTPEISGAVIACSGCGSASVQEEIYNAVSKALGISTSRIYVTKLK